MFGEDFKHLGHQESNLIVPTWRGLLTVNKTNSIRVTSLKVQCSIYYRHNIQSFEVKKKRLSSQFYSHMFDVGAL